ncbi:MAG: Do family serine endopeptidase [Candidatus Omnitrophica bacterium]|nr:Do family serine endopeptidase [Candidatus Omnitrophota bacterium]
MRKFFAISLVIIISSLGVFAADTRDFRNSIIDVAASVGGTVVSISSTVKEKVDPGVHSGSPLGDFSGEDFGGFFQEFFGEFPKELKRQGLGSGVIIDKDGYILTNEHVVSDASEIKVKLSDGRDYDAQIRGTDKRSDLAIIKIDAKNLPVAKLGNSDNLQIGEWMVAIGNPFGFAIESSEPTVTVGVVSALGRYIPMLGQRSRSYDDLIQTDAAINPGNSGGALVNLDSEIVGINTAIITTTGGYQGLGFAVPINKAKRILKKLIKGEKIQYGWLGVSVQDLNEDLRNYFGIKEKEGVIIVKVYKDSPAEDGSLKEGDLIIKFSGKSVKTTMDLVRMVSFTEVDKKVPVTVMRDGKEKVLKIKIGKRPAEEEDFAKLSERGDTFRGMEVENVSAAIKRKFRIKDDKGAVITYVKDGSLADKSGIEAGDVIIKVEKTKIANKDDFDSAVSKLEGNCLIKTTRGYVVLKGK